MTACTIFAPISRRLVCFLAMLAFCLSPPAVQADSIFVVSEPWPPYVFEQDGKAMGFDYETAKAVLESMGHTLHFRFYPWKRCLSMMRDGQADALLDVDINEERKAFMAYPSVPLSASETVLFFDKRRPFEFTSINDLVGKTVSTQLGYYYTKEFMDSDLFTKHPVRKVDNGFRMLLAGRVDLTVANRNFGLYMAKRTGLLNKLGHTSTPLSGGMNYLAFSRKGNHPDLAEEFATALTRFKSTRRYREILARYGQIANAPLQ